MAIATLDEVVAAEAAHDGTPATGVSLPPGGTGMMGWLSGIFSKLPVLGQAVRAGSLPVTIASDQPALPVTGTFFQPTQPVSAVALPLPAGAATETTLTAIKTALLAQADIGESLWVDSTIGTFYMRRVVDTDGVVTIVWTDASGVAASPTVANLRPLASDNALAITNTFYDVIAADTGNSVGDVLNRVIILNKAVSPPAVAGALWINATTGLAIAAPSVGNYVEATRDIKITAQSAGLALDGADITGSSMPAGGSGIRGWLSALYKATVGGAPNAATLTQSGALSSSGDAVVLALGGMNTIGVQLLTTSAWTAGGVVLEGSQDGGSTFPVPLKFVDYATGTAVTSIANGAANTPQNFELAIGALTHVRMRATGAIAGGPVAVYLLATNGLKSLRVGASAGNPVPTQTPPTAFVDRSGTTSATISPLTWTAPFPANAARQFARITNTSTAVIYVWDKAGTPAQTGAIPLQPGQSYVWDAKVPNTAIQVMSATASMTFEAAEG